MMNFLVLPQLSINTDNKDFSLVVAGGRKPDNSWFKEVSKDKEIYCADKGIEIAIENNLIPKLLLGDCDSTNKSFYEKAKDFGTKVELHPREKDDTDLQLLLKNLPDKNYIFTGIWGGRFDHLFANVYSLLNFKLLNKNKIIMADEKEIMLLMDANDEVVVNLKEKPKAISILPLSKEINVSIKNVRWELEKTDLIMLKPYAISNEALGDSFTFKCFSGCSGLYMIF